MSLLSNARQNAEKFADILRKVTHEELAHAMSSSGFNSLRDGILGLGQSGKFSTFYAPFDWVNDKADIVVVGITPGRSQALEALQVFRAAILNGKSTDEAAKLSKQSASFKGGMRTLGARLMDHFKLNRLFGLASTIELFQESAAQRTHYTSILKYPTLKTFGNYSGDAQILKNKFLRDQIHECLPQELSLLPNAWIVPFGSTALSVIDELARQRLIDGSKVLGGILHPGGQQWNRYNVQLGITDAHNISKVNGGSKVHMASKKLHSHVDELLVRQYS